MDVQKPALGNVDAGSLLDDEITLDDHPGCSGDRDFVSGLDDDGLLGQEDEVGVDVLPDIDGLHGVGQVVDSISDHVGLDLGGGVEADGSIVVDLTLGNSLRSDDVSTDEHAAGGLNGDSCLLVSSSRMMVEPLATVNVTPAYTVRSASYEEVASMVSVVPSERV